MIGEFNVIKGDVNSGELILEKGYKNVLLIDTKLVEDFGVIDVRLLITEDLEKALSESLLQIFCEEIEGPGFVAWFPLNNNQDCVTRNNLGLNGELSKNFCVDLIKSYGLKVLSKEGFGNDELEAA